MIDIRTLREAPEFVSLELAKRGVSDDEIRLLMELDERFRDAVLRRDGIRGSINSLSKEIAEAMRSKDLSRVEELKETSRELGAELSALERIATELEVKRRDQLLVIPNLPSPDAPDGRSEEDNKILRYWHPEQGELSSDTPLNLSYEEFQRLPHWEIGSAGKLLDLERAAKISGSMFALYRGDGARLIRALTSFALDRHSELFEEIRPPLFVKRETMVSTGHLPKFADDAYAIERDDLYAIPTSEVPLTSMAMDEILSEADLPLRFTAATPCFRREAGSAGKDTRGLLRLHEFDKVELLAYCTPQQAQSTHALLLSQAESILRELGLTYRVLDLCTGDLGSSSARTFDLEVYSPGTDKWLEVSSVSWFSDYQARRANIRYRPTDGSGVAFVHTLNGSALAWARIWAAIVEVYHNKDGSVTIPICLRPYFGGRDHLKMKQ